MKTFISWSGELSKNVAATLADWLPNFFRNAVSVFFSPNDIHAGSDWLRKLKEELDSCSCAIVCLTKDNLESTWLHFEAGAIGKHLADGCVCPLLVQPVSINDLTKGPFSTFQSATLNKHDLFRLVRSLNERLSAQEKRSEADLRDAFEWNWKSLEDRLNNSLSQYRRAFAYDLFASFPIRGFDSDETFERERMLLSFALRKFREESGMSVYCTAENATSRLHAPITRETRVFQWLRRSRAYVLILPAEASSFALVECGYALAHKLPVLIAASHPTFIPSALLDSFAAVSGYSTPDELGGLLLGFCDTKGLEGAVG